MFAVSRCSHGVIEKGQHLASHYVNLEREGSWELGKTH